MSDGASASLRYLGPTPASPYGMCCYLPQLTVGLFDRGGYVSLTWLFWSAELEWKRGGE